MKTRLADRKTHWQTATVPNWYGNTGRRIQFCSGIAIWYHGGLPPAPIRWVLIRDPEGRFDSLALLCTDPKAKPLDIIADYVTSAVKAADGNIRKAARQLEISPSTLYARLKEKPVQKSDV